MHIDTKRTRLAMIRGQGRLLLELDKLNALDSVCHFKTHTFWLTHPLAVIMDSCERESHSECLQ